MLIRFGDYEYMAQKTRTTPPAWIPQVKICALENDSIRSGDWRFLEPCDSEEEALGRARAWCEALSARTGR